MAIITLEERFWQKVDKSGGEDACWIWTGARTKEGYGNFRVGKKTTTAHRWIYEQSHGALKPGQRACHNCPTGDNPSCVNPAHIWPGSDKENAQDRERKGRGRRVPHRGKVSPELASEIRETFVPSWGAVMKHARKYSVSHATIRRVLDRAA